MALRLWGKPEPYRPTGMLIESSPTGLEEERYLFDHPVANPIDLNALIYAERTQDMGERVKFSDRAFFVTLVWVAFLVLLTFAQMAAVYFGKGLSDAQFITVITTTTASVFGFWVLVGRYLFRSSK